MSQSGFVAAKLCGAAVTWFRRHDVESLPHLFFVLWVFWAMRDHLLEVRSWIDELVSARATLDDHAQAELFWTAAVTASVIGDDRAALAARGRLEPLLGAIDDPYLEAVSHLAMAWILPIAGDFDGAVREASLCRGGLRDQDEPFWTAVATDTLGELEMSIGRLDDALRHLEEVRELDEQLDIKWFGFSWSQMGTLAILQGRLDDARTLLDDGLTMSLNADSTVGVTLSLAGFARLALVEGAPDRAAVAFGAAEGLRRRVGLRVWPTLRRGEADLVDQLEHALGADRFEKALATGSRLSRVDAVAIVRERGDAA